MIILPLITSKKTELLLSGYDSSATRLSLWRPLDFLPHPHEWFSLIGYHDVNIIAVTVDQKGAAVKGGGYRLG